MLLILVYAILCRRRMVRFVLSAWRYCLPPLKILGRE